MKNAASFYKSCFSYPKSYGVFVNGEVLVQELNYLKKGKRINPTVLVTEDSDYYYIHANIPGVAGKNFLIYLDLNVVSIYMLPAILDHTKQQKQQFNELGFRYYTHKIVLPENVGTELVTAVYKLDTLSIQVSKEENTSKCKHRLFFVES